MATAVASKSVVIDRMNLERDTKNTQRFAEVEDPDTGAVRLGTIYVPKELLAELGNPDAIRVTIEAA